MRVTQCDRCGKIYDPRNTITQKYIVQRGFNHYPYDFCDDCINEINETLDNFFKVDKNEN